MKFDLISDLHICSHPRNPGLPEPMSPICLVAGDMCCDPAQACQALADLAQKYQTVIYIDGNDEHRRRLAGLTESYQDLQTALAEISDVVYLYDRLVIVDDVAFVGTNGWWSYDADQRFTVDQGYDLVQNHLGVDQTTCDAVMAQALIDAKYLKASVAKLQTYSEVQHIVIMTHTVPWADLVEDRELRDSVRINTTVNTYIAAALEADTEHKVNTWCFGHYHVPVDQQRGGIRYVSNPRGRHGTRWYRCEAMPRRIPSRSTSARPSTCLNHCSSEFAMR